MYNAADPMLSHDTKYEIKRNGGKTESSVFSAFGVYYRQLGVEIFPGQPCNCWPYRNFRIYDVGEWNVFGAGPGSRIRSLQI